MISLHTALKELEDEAATPGSLLLRAGTEKSNQVQELLETCKTILSELEKLLSKYKSLGTRHKRKWDIIRFGTEGLGELRIKIAFHTSAINLFLTTLSTSSLGRIECSLGRLESKLEQMADEIRRGIREASTVTDLESNEPDAERAWSALEDELVEAGFAREDINEEEGEIRQHLLELVHTGATAEDPISIEEEHGESTVIENCVATVEESPPLMLNYSTSRASPPDSGTADITAHSRPRDRRNSDVSMADAAGVAVVDVTQGSEQHPSSTDNRVVVFENTRTVTQQQEKDSVVHSGILPHDLITVDLPAESSTVHKKERELVKFLAKQRSGDLPVVEQEPPKSTCRPSALLVQKIPRSVATSEFFRHFSQAGAEVRLISKLTCDCCDLKTCIVYFHSDGDAERVIADPGCYSINGSDLALHVMSDRSLLNVSDTPADANEDDLPVVRQTEGYRSYRERSCEYVLAACTAQPD